MKALSPLARQGLILIALVLIFDQLSKAWILYGLDLDGLARGGQVQVFDPWFNLTMVWNRGISFGLFAADSLGPRLILVALSLGISGLLLVWLLKAKRRLQALAYGMIIGGAIGNVIDRLAYGAVVDFFDFSGLYFPYVFNIADAAISLGVAALLLDLFLHGEDDSKQEHKSGASTTGAKGSRSVTSPDDTNSNS